MHLRCHAFSIFAIVTWSFPVAAQEAPITITHGPIVGRPGSRSMAIWARTSRPGTFRVEYSASQKDTIKVPLDMSSAPVTTTLEGDCTGWIVLKGLKPNCTYNYRVVADGKVNRVLEPVASFRTLPEAEHFKHATHNPEGLFNFRFSVGCCANQGEHSLGAELPAYKSMLAKFKDKVLFGIHDGDFIYEEARELTAKDWLDKVAGKTAQAPRVVELAPTLPGVWENYKLYLSRGKNLAAWHRRVPTFFTFDDHEILNDVNGCGHVGLVDRRAVFRDIAVQAWYDYVGWANPVVSKQGIRFGRCELQEGKDILTDKDADFTTLYLKQAANLHIHWGTADAGINDEKLDKQPPADQNAGVYEIVEVLDKNRLRIKPAARKSTTSVYSIGRLSYYDWRVGNCHFFALDARTHRTLHDLKLFKPAEMTMLGEAQKKWLKDGMAKSDADFFFIVSSVNLMIPHDGSGGMSFAADDKDDAWTAYVHEREELIRFWETLERPVVVFTGDLHNSFAVKVTDRVWEFASAPLNSRNHNAGSEGKRPANGPFNSRGRMCDIRWSSYFMDDTPRDDRKQPVYLIVQINNAFNNPLKEGQDRWIAYPHPQAVFQYYDGFTGDLMYAESIRGGKQGVK